MTAEIAILNKHGIALAADSAVTIGAQKKIFLSANKIFTISKFYPIAIMIFSSSEYAGIPWEVIIKVYRKSIGNKNFPTLEAASDDFIEYIRRMEISKIIQDDFVKSTCDAILAELYDLVDSKCKELSKFKEVSDSDIHQAFVDILYKMSLEKKQIQKLKLRDEVSIDNFNESFSELIRRQYDEAFKSIPIFSDAQYKQFFDCIYYVITGDLFNPGFSGIVIAGYGENDIFPKLRSHLISGNILGHIKYAPVESINIDNNNSSSIVPFAQKDIVDIFMKGIDNQYEHTIFSFINYMFSEYNESIIFNLPVGADQQRREYVKKITDSTESIKEKFKKEIETYKWKNHIAPVLSVVANLPKAELALMAESLVSLTSIKRKVSPIEETVGGPTDVAVISKGDGFVWIKRKHYFSQEQNHHFFANYFEV